MLTSPIVLKADMRSENAFLRRLGGCPGHGPCRVHRKRDASFFKHHRHVEQRNGETVFKLARLRKSIYSLNDLRQLMAAANARYLTFMADIDNPKAGQKALAKMAAPTKVKGRSFRGFDLFLDPDYQLFLTLARGEWSISGFRARDRSPCWASCLSQTFYREYRHNLSVVHPTGLVFTRIGKGFRESASI